MRPLGRGAPIAVTIGDAQPAFFFVALGGRNWLLAQHADYSLIGPPPATPARPGETILVGLRIWTDISAAVGGRLTKMDTVLAVQTGTGQDVAFLTSAMRRWEAQARASSARSHRVWL